MSEKEKSGEWRVERRVYMGVVRVKSKKDSSAM